MTATNLGSYRRLQVRRDTSRLVQCLRGEANRFEAEARQMGAAYRAARLKLNGPADVAITDHAVIRFLERVMGIDIDAIRAQIARLIPEGALPLAVEDHTDRHGLLLVDDFQFLLTPDSLISVLSEDMDSTAWLGLTSRDEFAANPTTHKSGRPV